MEQKRQSHAKRRTGCITCKIRRLRCDEEKPSCRRCVSTGRKCDGYASLVREFHPALPAAPRTPSTRSTPRTPLFWQRPTVVIRGSEPERRFFYSFRVATEAGVALHVGNVSDFWTDLAPRLAQYHDALKHAVVALGAAYHFFKTTREGSSSAVTSRYAHAQVHVPAISRLEMFILRQYDLAMQKLNALISSDHPERGIVAVMCSLVFICFENLRFNHRGAITHLRSGVQIIESSFDLGYLFSPAAGADRPPLCRDVSDDELRGIINYFRHLEICERLFAYDVPLTLAPRLYTRSRFDDGGSLPAAFSSLDEAHKARLDLTNDVMARDYETRNHRGDTVFWTAPDIAMQHSCLSSRARAMSATYLAFLAGPNAPKHGTREDASSQLDMLQIKCMASVIAMMPLLDSDCNVENLPQSLLEDTLLYAEKLYDTRIAFTKNTYTPLDFTTETGVVAPLYFALVYATYPEHKARIMRMLSDCTTREGPWDGRSLAKLIQRSSEASAIAQKSPGAANPLRKWGGNTDCLELFSALGVTAW